MLGSDYARVLAWSLGRQLGPRDLTSTRQQVDELRRSDPLARPILGAVDGDLWAYSQMLDAIVADQPVIGSTFPLRQFEAWLRVRRRLMRSETPLWVAVQTEPSVELQTQIDGLLPARGESHALEPNQVRSMTFAAAAAGARGIYFRSNSPLNAPGPTAERRAKTLQMLNAELELLEPWMAGGTPGPSIDAADPNVRIASLMTDRSQILLVTRQADDQQFVSSVPSTEAIHFVVPGSSGTGDVFQVTSQGLLPLTHRRGAGGVRVVLENAGLATLVLVAREQLVLNHVARSVRQASREFPQWRFEEATRQFEEIRAASAEGIVPMSDLQRLGRTAEMYLRETERVLSTGDAMSADHYLVRAESALAQLRRSAWEQAAAAFPSPVTSPLCVSFDTLPLHWRLSGALRSAAWSSNLLAGGEFEDLNHTLASGWQQHRRPIDHVAANVEFSLETPQSGRSCLRMQTWKTDQQAAPTVMEVAPLWITSAATPVEAGQVVRIHGWVKVPEAIEGSLDGLMIFDSFGGQSLAERVTRTGGWREFL
ncbi:MAG: hypothetical protein KDA55_14590, partial [Planctomycetales bacterium]|nr:hypothetical protein [Planctomycetales bacterium]